MKYRLHPLLLSVLVLLSGFCIAQWVVVWQEDEQRRKAEQRFHDLAQRTREQLVRRMQKYQYGLRGLRSVIITMGEDGITRSHIINYSESRDQDQEFPGARGFGFIRRVPVADEATFLTQARRDDKPDFTIHQLTPHDHERLIIQYAEPEYRNREAIGLDIASEADRRKAALQAIRTGEPILTHPITLVQASGKAKHGFLLLLPIYRTGSTPATPEEREQSAFGLAYALLVIDEVLDDFDFHHNEFRLTLYDQADDGKVDRFYEPEAPAPVADGLTERRPLELFGRRWIVEVKALPPFIAGLNQASPGQTGFAITLGSLVLAGSIYGLLVIQVRKREIFQEKGRLAAIVEEANDAIIGMTLDGIATDWNPAAETIFGYPADAVIGHKVVDLIVPDQLKDEEATLIARLIEGNIVHDIHTRRRRADGGKLEVSLTLSPIRDDKGQVTGIAKTIRDISIEIASRQCIQDLNNELERKVVERTAHLETAVQELIDFSYLASHDLRTPLRAVDGFSSLLLHGRDDLSATETEYLQRIRSAAQHMGRIIDDMVTLIGIVRTESNPQDLDFSAIAQAEVAKLQAREPERMINVHIQPGLQIYADLNTTSILLRQLIDNAWKFTRGVPEAKIEIGCEMRNHRLEYFVRDNGIGFDGTLSKQIFAPFQKLHHDGRDSGSGIGLAIAQRIVHKHGGYITADAFPGLGATFYFALQPLHDTEAP